MNLEERQRVQRLVLAVSLIAASVLIGSGLSIARAPGAALARDHTAQALDQLPEGKGKELIAKNCVACHGPRQSDERIADRD